jgi:ankyrin repeat protein
MTRINYLPAGYSESEDEEECYRGHFKNIQKPTKSAEKILNEKLLLHLKENDLKSLRMEINNAKNFNIDAEIDNNWPLLFHACSLAFTYIVKFLLHERNCDRDRVVDGTNAMMVALTYKNDPQEVFTIIKMLMIDSRTIGMINCYGENLVILAAKNGYSEILKYLIVNKVSIDAIDNTGWNVSIKKIFIHSLFNDKFTYFLKIRLCITQ